MTPYELKLILAIYVSPEWECVFDASTRSNELWAASITRFQELGLLSGGQRTDKLIAYVESLCKMPLPVQRWVMP